MPDDDEKSPLDRLKYLKNPNHDRYKKSKKHEERIAKAMGGRRLPQSGGKLLRGRKVPLISTVSFRDENPEEGRNITLDGDISQRKFHIEHKSTERESIALKKEWLDKVSEGAAETNTTPALVVTFVSDRLGVPDSDWALIPFSLFQRTWKSG